MKKITSTIILLILLSTASKLQADTAGSMSLKMKLGMTKQQVNKMFWTPEKSEAHNTKRGFFECLTYDTGNILNPFTVLYANNKAVAWGEDSCLLYHY